CCSSSCFGCSGNGNAYIRLLAGRSVIHAVTGHSHDVAVLLQYFYNCVFVVRENLSESIGLIDFLSSVQWDLSFCNVAGEELRCRLDICAHIQFRSDLPCDGDVITGNHLYLHSVGASPCYSALGVRSRRIKKRQNSLERPWTIAFRDSNTNSAIAMTGQTIYCLAGFLEVTARELCQPEDHLRRTFGNSKNFTRGVLDRCFRSLVHRIERDILFLVKALKCVGIFQTGQYCKVDGIVVCRTRS